MSSAQNIEETKSSNTPILLQNTTDVDQIVYVEDGKSDEPVSYTLPADTARYYRPELAQLFLEQRGRFVRKYEEVDLPEILGRPNTWVANMTGSPFLRDKARLKRFKDGKWTQIEIDNPNKKPTILTFEVNMGQRMEERPDGPYYYNLGSTQFHVAPGHRKYVPELVAEQILGSDQAQESDLQGKMIACREPAEFEPNELWPMQDVVAYAILLDKKTFNATHLATLLGGKQAEVLEKENPAQLEEAKYVLLQQVRYRLFDEKYTAPTEAAFKAFKKTLASKPGSRSTGK